MLKPGLYEQVINKELSDKIDDSAQLVDRRNIDKAEAPQVLAGYLSEVIEKGLSRLSGDDIEGQLGLANKIVSTVTELTGDDEFDGLSVDQRAEQLLAINEAEKLPQAQLLIANLLIEYIGYGAFQRAVLQTAPEYVFCVIQINTDEVQRVSESPYLRAFDRLDEVHHQMEKETLTAAMNDIGYSLILQESYPLPNGKALVRLDFNRKR
jgi:hypothetical protein